LEFRFIKYICGGWHIFSREGWGKRGNKKTKNKKQKKKNKNVKEKRKTKKEASGAERLPVSFLTKVMLILVRG
jgi:hypothetical protein